MKFRLLGILVILLSLLSGVTIGCQAEFTPGTYTDDMGREVVIDEVPQRIVSFGPSITEILFALGLGEKVVGVSDYSDYPEAAQSKPSVGNAYAPSIESLVALEPDLVFTLEHQELNSQLEALGMTFIILEPRDVDGILEDIELVGAVTGTEDEAAELVESMQETIDDTLALVEGAAEVSVFFIVDATDPSLPWTSGSGSFIDALITMAGGENIAAEAPGDWVQLSLEQVVASDPDIVIIQTMTGGVPTVSIEALEEHPIWGEMRAIIEGNVFLISGDLVSRSGPRIVQGLEEMARIIHPELFE
jgi:iron complex transport system substrate-binding protein